MEEPNHISAAIADLKAWRERIDAAIQTLEVFGTQGLALPTAPPPGHRPGPEDIPHDAFFQMTIPDAAFKFLTLTKRTRPNTELSEALLNGGLKTAAKNFPENVRSMLTRDGRFVKVNGEWGLADWYPAMRRERKTKSNGSDGPAKSAKPRTVARAKHQSKPEDEGDALPARIKEA